MNRSRTFSDGRPRALRYANIREQNYLTDSKRVMYANKRLDRAIKQNQGDLVGRLEAEFERMSNEREKESPYFNWLAKTFKLYDDGVNIYETAPGAIQMADESDISLRPRFVLANTVTVKEPSKRKKKRTKRDPYDDTYYFDTDGMSNYRPYPDGIIPLGEQYQEEWNKMTKLSQPSPIMGNASDYEIERLHGGLSPELKDYIGSYLTHSKYGTNQYRRSRRLNGKRKSQRSKKKTSKRISYV